tara:strand:+ start:89011 stop:92028 length:3018 start_codon:yes stop_codon:yes gene_type:complete
MVSSSPLAQFCGVVLRYFTRCLFLTLPLFLVAHVEFASAQVAAQKIFVDGKSIKAVAPADRPSSAKPSETGKPNPSGDASKEVKGEGGAKEGKKPGESPEVKVIRRGQDSDEHADPNELKATVGEDGRVAFQFRNQPWEDLIQWLADISDQPLDWLELPGDRVNLRSPGRYTVEETRNLFNRYLLARGYTLLELDGGLTVAKTAGINPAIVPRVDIRQLGSLPSYSFVRISLDVAWLSAEKLTEELKPMISTNGKLTALTTTNRIEAMDAAINLQQVAELLERERDSASREALAPEFKLRYLPAEEAKVMLEQFLGVEKKQAAPMTPQQMQMMQQMRQQNAGKSAPEPKKDDIAIVANTRQNSVLIRAPIDRVTIAFKFLERVDVPRDTMFSLADVQSRIDVIRLETLDPEKLIEIVSEMNVLEPTTRVRVDKDNGALIVSGSAADRFIIKSVVERLDGSGRQVHVLQLRHLPPTEVADSITFLMGKEEKEEKKSSRYSYYYGFSNNDEEEKEADEFRVAANSRSRQIMLWANEQELEQVQSLLIKLGELPPPDGSDRTLRVIDASATPETYEYLQRLRRQWSHMSPNPLQIPDEAQFDEDSESQESETKEDREQESDSPASRVINEGDVAGHPKPSELQLTATKPPAGELDVADNDTAEISDTEIRSARDFDRVFGNRERDDRNIARRTANTGAPISIELDENGNLIIVSEDTEALDKLEQLMLQVAPPQRPYYTFKIEHASVYMVYLNLKEYFDEGEDGESDGDSFYRWYFGGGDDDDDKKPSGLGRDDELRFVYDPDTSTIVVRGASSQQLATVRNLIREWDIPPREDTSKNRYLELVALKYGRAEKIAETVKEALLDLLSSSDKAFRQGNSGNKNKDEKQGRNKEKSGSNLVDSKNGNESGEVDMSFKGKLSLGVDTQGNTLLVSAEGDSLLKLVIEMISKLDEAARPSGEVQVLQLEGGLGGEAIGSALRSFGASSAGNVAPTKSGAVNNPADSGGDNSE